MPAAGEGGCFLPRGGRRPPGGSFPAGAVGATGDDDTLTGMHVRWVFHQQLGHALTLLQRHPGHVAVLFLDVDGLKYVNDTYGHLAGDDCCGPAPSGSGRPCGPATCWPGCGGDEFVVLLEHVHGTPDAQAVATRVLDALSAPWTLHDHQLNPSASIGIAVADTADTAADTLISHADAAMYRAKQAGRGRVEVFDPASYAQASTPNQNRATCAPPCTTTRWTCTTNRSSTSTPAASTPSKPCCAGATPNAEPSPPGTSFPSRKAPRSCSTSANGSFRPPAPNWRNGTDNSDPQLPPTSSSTSPRSNSPAPTSSDASPTHWPPTTSDRSGWSSKSPKPASSPTPAKPPPCWRTSRTSAAPWPSTTSATGAYSSLSRLLQLPAHTLKIDHSFTRRLPQSPDSIAVISSVLLLGHNLKRTIVVEGVEDEATLTILRDLGCMYAQGYHLGLPQPPNQLTRTLTPESPGGIR